MPEPSFGTWLRRERERRGATLKTISDQTKVSVPLLQGLETDDLSKWPTGIFRRGFVRSYATAIGLDADDVIKRFEQQHTDAPAETNGETAATPLSDDASAPVVERRARQQRGEPAATSKRARVLGTAADLTVALVLGLGSAAADSRLLWPVLLIAVYYALGVLLTGTSPMVALLGDQVPSSAGSDAPAPTASPRTGPERRLTPRRAGSRGGRPSRHVRQRVQ